MIGSSLDCEKRNATPQYGPIPRLGEAKFAFSILLDLGCSFLWSHEKRYCVVSRTGWLIEANLLSWYFSCETPIYCRVVRFISVAWLSDEVKLQTAPLMALRLELMQARSETEMMRQRLKEERRESRLRCTYCCSLSSTLREDGHIRY